MHNYIVPNKYKFQTRIGNWSEEWELEETKNKDYNKLKQTGQLNTTIKDQNKHFCMRPASLSIPEQYLRFGNHFMLYNYKTNGLLAFDIQEKINCQEEAFTITTTSLTTEPVVRNVFVITKWEKEPNFFNDDYLHYGQKFRIIANPRVSANKTYWLHSLPVTPQRCSKFSRKQEISVINNDCFNTVWCLEYADPKIRFEMDGQPVGVDDPVLIKHVFTSQWLASDDVTHQNSWGKEKEVFCHSFSCLNKTQNLIAEKTGRTTIDIPMRNQEPQNLWRFLLANEPSQNFDEAIIDDTKGVHNLVARIKQQIMQKGVQGVRGLAKLFEEMDQNKNFVLEYDDFKWGLRNYGIQTTEDETKIIFQEFDKNKNGVLDYQEFLSVFRVQPNERRSKLIEDAYSVISQKSKGIVTIESLGKFVDIKKHPEVVRGIRSEKEVFKSFINNWDKSQPDKPIDFEQFYQYYSDISSSVEKDEFFELLLRNQWGF